MAQKTIGAGTRGTATLFDGAYPKGEIARAYRGTAAGPTSGTTELSILRLDDIAMEADRSYRITVSGIRFDQSVATDHFKWNLRYSTSGDATTSSTVLNRTELTGDTDTGPPIIAWRRPTSAETVSILLTLLRTLGTGTATTTADDENDIQMVVEDCGVAVADTGTVL